MDKTLKKILILGADGFIGSNLAKLLSKDGDCVVYAFDLFKDGVSRNVQKFSDDLIMVQGNFLNKSDIAKAVKGMDYVFHFISLTTPGSSMDDPLIDVDTNIRGTIMLLEECVKAGVEKVIFSSSGGAIYGNQNKGKYSENDQVDPISPYAISKLAIEKYLQYYKNHRGLDYLILRYSNPYGPGQNIVGSQGIIPIFLNLIKNKESITIFGDGENVRDYIFIDDAIAVTKKMYDRDLKYSVYNVGSGKGVSINEINSIMENVIGMSVEKKYVSSRDIDVRSVVLDVCRVENEIGKTSTISLKDGIKKTWDWINQ